MCGSLNYDCMCDFLTREATWPQNLKNFISMTCSQKWWWMLKTWFSHHLGTFHTPTHDGHMWWSESPLTPYYTYMTTHRHLTSKNFLHLDEISYTNLGCSLRCINRWEIRRIFDKIFLTMMRVWKFDFECSTPSIYQVIRGEIFDIK